MYLYMNDENFNINSRTIIIGQYVCANGLSIYRGLWGKVREIRTGVHKETNNPGADIIVDFEIPMFGELRGLNKEQLQGAIMSIDMISTGDVICIEESDTPNLFTFIKDSPLGKKAFLNVELSTHTFLHMFEEDLLEIKSELPSDELILAEFNECIGSVKCPACGRKIVNGLTKDYRNNGGCIGSVFTCVNCCSFTDEKFFELSSERQEIKLKTVFDELSCINYCNNLYNAFEKEYKLENVTRIYRDEFMKLISANCNPVFEDDYMLLEYRNDYIKIPCEGKTLNLASATVLYKEELETMATK